MNRNQRRFGRTPKSEYSDARLQTLKDGNKNEPNIEEVLSPRSKRERVKEKSMVNRCCYVTPDRRSFAQLTDGSNNPSQFETLLVEQYGPVLPDTMNDINELRKLCSPHQAKVDSGSQYSIDGAHWLNVDNADDIDMFIARGRDEGTLTQYHNLPKHFHISEVPRVKIIAEKFTKYKNNNVEVRKLDEKVVCMEYDVFGHSVVTPVQRMRAFFSVKPVNKEKEENVLTKLPSNIKNKFNISSTYLQKPTQKEVEIIDGTIIENQPYLNDLRKLLLRRQSSPKRDKNTLNLDTLYQMAKREFLEFDTVFDTNLLSKEELLDVHNLILENCKSSIHGIRRRTLESSKTPSDHINDVILNGDTISRSILTELLKGEGSLISLRSG